MKNSTQFITAISNINWIDYDRGANTSGTLKSDNGFSLSFSTKFHEAKDLPSVQIVAQVCFNETYIMSWGFIDDDSQRQFIALLNSVKDAIHEAKHEQEKHNLKLGQELLNQY